MVTTKKFIGHIAPMALIVIIGLLDISAGEDHCKNVFMNVYNRHCSGRRAARAKRQMEHPEVQLAEIEPNSARIEFSEYGSTAKREIDAGRAIADVATPLVTGIIERTLTGGSRTSSMAARYAPAPYPYGILPIAAPYPGGPQYYIAAAPPPPRSMLYQSESKFGRGFLPQATGDDLGFDPSEDDMDEQWNEILDRITRNSVSLKEKLTSVLAECCPHEQRCFEKITALDLEFCQT